MNEFQYCYWLMGIFELGKPQSFTSHQVLLIQEHLQLVQHRQYIFCNWLEGFLDANGSKPLEYLQLQTILIKLQLEFQNVIDVSYPKEIWESLTLAHEGKSF